MPYRFCYFLALVFSTPVVDAEQQIASIGDLALSSGAILEDCQIGYRLYGEMNEDKSNILVFPTWFSGSTADLENFKLIGPGLLADTDQYFVVAIDALGNGISSSPSNFRASGDDDFPVVSTEDMVNSQHILLTTHLDIQHVKAVIGISMGGMQTFRWMAQYPEFMDKAIPIDGSPTMTSYDLIQWQTHKDIVGAMQEGGHSNAAIGVVLSRLGLLTLFTPDYFLEHVPVDGLPAFLEESDQSYAQTNVDDYVSQLEAMIDHDVLENSAGSMQEFAAGVSASVLIIGVASDHMVNPAPARQLGLALGAEYLAVESNCGHIGSSCEAALVSDRVARFLAGLEACLGDNCES